MKTLNLKKKRLIGRKEVIVVVAAVILTTVGIKAADKIMNPNGSEVATGGDKGCSPDMTFVTMPGGGFCIDKYEASVGSDCPNKNPSNQDQSRENLDINTCKPLSTSGALPWTSISQNQAEVACAKAGKRLPTNKEWLAAALGTPDKSSGWGADDCDVASNWASQPGTSGSGKNCVSSYGAYDMIGNVWEWVYDTANDGKFNGRELPKNGYVKGVDSDAVPSETDPNAGDPNYNEDFFWIKSQGTRGFARGGYWDNKSDAGAYAVYLESPPSFVGNAMGFRCAK